MLSVELKVCGIPSSTQVWNQPLKSSIETIFFDEAEKFTPAIEAFEKLRYQTVSSNSPDEAARTNLIQYLGQLKKLKLHFALAEPPFSNLNFSWYLMILFFNDTLGESVDQ